MSLRSRLLTWWRAVRREEDVHAQIDEELRFHVESYAADLMRGGTTRAEALRRALAELGSLAANRENCRAASGTRWLDELRGDLRYAVRILWKSPGEPSGWHGVHRDLEPVQPDYATIVSLGTQYGSMIKTADPSAKILGPSDYTEYGWIWYVPSGTSLYAGQYYLQKMAAYATAHGNTRILDYFDEHWGCPDTSSPAAELNSTRTLWDPSYNTGSPFEFHMGGPVMMIPRLQSWVNSYYPGTPISISEYECVAKPSSPTIIDALAEVEILGVFGDHSVALANNFNVPKPNDPLSFSCLMYLNYDGKGSRFGDTSVTSTSTVPATLSVHGALRSSDGKLTVVVINKTSSKVNTALSLTNFNAGNTAAVYTYSGADLTHIATGPAVALSSDTVEYGFPAYSATLFVFDSAN